MLKNIYFLNILINKNRGKQKKEAKLDERNKKLAEEMANLVFTLRQKCAAKDMVFVRRLHITPAEFNCLLQFFNNDGLNVKDLAKRLHITPGGVTRIVTSLEKKGILKREIAPHDRRGILVSLTEEGKNVVHEIKHASEELHGEILEKIEPEHRQAIVTAVQQLINAIDEWLSHQDIEEEPMAKIV